MDPKCLYGLDGSDSGFEMSFDSETEAAAFSLDDTAGSEGFGGSSAASAIDDDPGQPAKPKKRRQRKTRERSPTQVKARVFLFSVESIPDFLTPGRFSSRS